MHIRPTDVSLWTDDNVRSTSLWARTGFDEDEERTAARPGRMEPGQKTVHRTKANDNVVSLEQYRKTRMVAIDGMKRLAIHHAWWRQAPQ